MKRVAILAMLLACPAVVRAGNCFWVTAPADTTITASYDVFNAGTYSVTQNFIFHCTPNTTATMTINRGSNSAGYLPSRTARITNPPVGYAGTLLSYQLYNNLGQVWGDGTGGSFPKVFNSSPKDKDYDVTDGAVITATAPMGSDVPPGTYDDTLTASLTWGGGGGPVTSSFRVIIIVQPQCKAETFSILFGTYDPMVTNLSTPKDASGTVNVKCSKSTFATVQLNQGASLTGSRQMKNPAGDLLPYDVYKDSARSVVWNTVDTNSGTSTSAAIPLGPGAGGFTAYGRIAANLDVTGGDYKDTLQAVVNY